MQRQLTIWWENSDIVIDQRQRRLREAVESNDTNMVDCGEVQLGMEVMFNDSTDLDSN